MAKTDPRWTQILGKPATYDHANIHIPSGKDVLKACDDTEVLFIGAHQDDAEISCPTEIQECLAKGKGFSAVIVTDGAGSPGTPWRKEKTDAEVLQTIEMRQNEQIAAANMGKYSAVFQLAANAETIRSEAVKSYDVESTDKNGNQYFDPKLKDKAFKTTQEIYEILMKTKPKRVVTHQPLDDHKHHRGVLLHTLQAIALMPKELRPKEILGAEIWEQIPTALKKNHKYQDTPILQYEMIDTKAYDEYWRRHLECFKSQIEQNPYHIGSPARAQATKTYDNPHVESVKQTNDGAIKRMNLAPIIELADEIAASKNVGMDKALPEALDSYLTEVAKIVNGQYGMRKDEICTMACIPENHGRGQAIVH